MIQQHPVLPELVVSSMSNAMTSRHAREMKDASPIKMGEWGRYRGYVALPALHLRHTAALWITEKIHLRSGANVSQFLRLTGPRLLQRARLLPAGFCASLESTTLGTKP